MDSVHLAVIHFSSLKAGEYLCTENVNAITNDRTITRFLSFLYLFINTIIDIDKSPYLLFQLFWVWETLKNASDFFVA